MGRDRDREREGEREREKRWGERETLGTLLRSMPSFPPHPLSPLCYVSVHQLRAVAIQPVTI
jgi:hypothetical protein